VDWPRDIVHYSQLSVRLLLTVVARSKFEQLVREAAVTKVSRIREPVAAGNSEAIVFTALCRWSSLRPKADRSEFSDDTEIAMVPLQRSCRSFVRHLQPASRQIFARGKAFGQSLFVYAKWRISVHDRVRRYIERRTCAMVNGSAVQR